MLEAADYLLHAVLIGVGATAVMDLWAVVRTRLLGAPSPDYGLVGRWLAHMPRGRFRHEAIGAARLRSLVTHGVFGLGLYAAAWAVRLLDL